MSYQRSALPLKMNVAFRLDVDHSGRAPPSREIFIGGLFPEFDLISNLVVDHLNCLARLGSKSSTGSLGC
eukprot:8384852-Prorocentrum_lima.AAC.1